MLNQNKEYYETIDESLDFDTSGKFAYPGSYTHITIQNNFGIIQDFYVMLTPYIQPVDSSDTTSTD